MRNNILDQNLIHKIINNNNNISLKNFNNQENKNFETNEESSSKIINIGNEFVDKFLFKENGTFLEFSYNIDKTDFANTNLNNNIIYSSFKANSKNFQNNYSDCNLPEKINSQNELIKIVDNESILKTENFIDDLTINKKYSSDFKNNFIKNTNTSQNYKNEKYYKTEINTNESVSPLLLNENFYFEKKKNSSFNLIEVEKTKIEPLIYENTNFHNLLENPNNYSNIDMRESSRDEHNENYSENKKSSCVYNYKSPSALNLNNKIKNISCSSTDSKIMNSTYRNLNNLFFSKEDNQNLLHFQDNNHHEREYHYKTSLNFNTSKILKNHNEEISKKGNETNNVYNDTFNNTYKQVNRSDLDIFYIPCDTKNSSIVCRKYKAKRIFSPIENKNYNNSFLDKTNNFTNKEYDLKFIKDNVTKKINNNSYSNKFKLNFPNLNSNSIRREFSAKKFENKKSNNENRSLIHTNDLNLTKNSIITDKASHENKLKCFKSNPNFSQVKITKIIKKIKNKQFDEKYKSIQQANNTINNFKINCFNDSENKINFYLDNPNKNSKNINQIKNVILNNTICGNFYDENLNNYDKFDLKYDKSKSKNKISESNKYKNKKFSSKKNSLRSNINIEEDLYIHQSINIDDNLVLEDNPDEINSSNLSENYIICSQKNYCNFKKNPCKANSGNSNPILSCEKFLKNTNFIKVKTQNSKNKFNINKTNINNQKENEAKNVKIKKKNNNINNKINYMITPKYSDKVNNNILINEDSIRINDNKEKLPDKSINIINKKDYNSLKIEENKNILVNKNGFQANEQKILKNDLIDNYLEKLNDSDADENKRFINNLKDESKNKVEEKINNEKNNIDKNRILKNEKRNENNINVDNFNVKENLSNTIENNSINKNSIKITRLLNKNGIKLNNPNSQINNISTKCINHKKIKNTDKIIPRKHYRDNRNSPKIEENENSIIINNNNDYTKSTKLKNNSKSCLVLDKCIENLRIALDNYIKASRSDKNILKNIIKDNLSNIKKENDLQKFLYANVLNNEKFENQDINNNLDFKNNLAMKYKNKNIYNDEKNDSDKHNDNNISDININEDIEKNIEEFEKNPNQYDTFNEEEFNRLSDDPEDIKNFIIQHLESYKLGLVKEKLEKYFEKLKIEDSNLHSVNESLINLCFF